MSSPFILGPSSVDFGDLKQYIIELYFFGGWLPFRATKYYEYVILGVGIDLIGDFDFQKRIERSPILLDSLLKLSHPGSPDAETTETNGKINNSQMDIQRAKSNLVSIEALFKALPSNLRSELDKLKFSRDELGKPTIVYLGHNLEILNQLVFHVSISHDSGVTIGIVIIESA